MSDKSWMVKSAILSGLAEALDGPKTLEQLVELGYDARVVEALLYALQQTSPPTVQYTEKENHYVWTGSQFSKQELFQFEMERRKLMLLETLKSGKPVGELEPWIYQILSKEMIKTAQSLAQPVTAYVQKHIAPNSTGIDVGGAHGIFSLDLLKNEYDMHILDLPISQSQSKEWAPTIPFISQDILQEPLQLHESYDWALLVRFIRMHSPEDISLAVQHLEQGMKKQSKLIIVDSFREYAANADQVAINMILNTPSGNAYQLKQVKNILSDWSLHDMTIINSQYVATLWQR